MTSESSAGIAAASTAQAEAEAATETQAPIDDRLVLTIPGAHLLTGRPRARFEFVIRRVSVDVLKEASNLATGRPPGGGKKQTEFHSDHVDKAFSLIAERGLKRNPRPWWYSWGRIAQGILTVLAGGAAAMMSVPGAGAGWGYLFVGLFASTIILVITLEIADRSLS